MLSKLTLALLPVFIASVFASPSSLNIEGRASNVDTSSHCGQYDTVTAGTYTLFVNLWGKKDATSGSQCSNINSLSGNTIAWKTTWNWVGGTGIKSYSNIQQNAGINKQLSAIKSIPVSTRSIPSALSLRPCSVICLSDYVEMVAKVVWIHCCRRCLRPIHRKHGWRL